MDVRPPGPENGSGEPDTRPPGPESPSRDILGAPPGTPAQTEVATPGTPAPDAGTGGQEPIRLREMRIGELLDTGIKLYRSAWKTFLGIAAIVLVPLAFLQSFLTRSALGQLSQIGEIGQPGAPVPEPSDAAFVATIVFGLIGFFFVMPLLTGAFAKAASEVYLGHEPDPLETLRFAISRVRSILLVAVLTGIVAVGGFLLLIVPGIIFMVRLTFGSAVVAIEGARGRAAMRRSWRLAKGSFWKIAGTLALTSIITSIVGGLIGLPLSLAAEVIGPKGWALAALGGSIAQVLTQPFTMIIVVLLYFDLRIRKEGFDLTLMIEEVASDAREP